MEGNSADRADVVEQAVASEHLLCLSHDGLVFFSAKGGVRVSTLAVVMVMGSWCR